MYAPYNNEQCLKEYTWVIPSMDVSITVRRLEQDKHIPPDLNECYAAGMKLEDYDKGVRWWRQL